MRHRVSRLQALRSLKVHDGVDEVLEGVRLLGAGHVHLHGAVLVEAQAGHGAVNQVADLLSQPARVAPGARTELADVARACAVRTTAGFSRRRC